MSGTALVASRLLFYYARRICAMNIMKSTLLFLGISVILVWALYEEFHISECLHGLGPQYGDQHPLTHLALSHAQIADTVNNLPLLGSNQPINLLNFNNF